MRKFILFLLLSVPAAASAQEVPLPVPATAEPTKQEAAAESAVAASPAEKNSLFFTKNQVASILRANQGYVPPKEAFDENNQGATPYDSGPRVIWLSGIVYQGANDWTIWLNGERVTPKNKPDHVMGLKVEKDRIHLRWMDIGRQRVINIVLKPHQRYVLDNDTIIPGT